MSVATNKTQLRKMLRSERQAFTGLPRMVAEYRLLQHLHHFRPFQRAMRVAVYLSADGEARLSPLFEAYPDKQFYLPNISGFRKKQVFLSANQKVRLGRFGLYEPKHGQAIDVRRLDLVLMPLVGFDKQGNRLGMGGGFYDRSFAYLNRQGGLRKPVLCGVAFGFQEVPNLPKAPWDVGLDHIVTERGVLTLASARSNRSMKTNPRASV